MLDMAEIQFPAAQAGSPDAYERQIRLEDRFHGIGRGPETPGFTLLGYHLGHARFQDGTSAGIQHLHFGRAHIDADDLEAERRKARGGYRADITQTENTD